MGNELAMTPDEKIENLLFVIYVQDQRVDYWREVLKDTVEALEKIRDDLS